MAELTITELWRFPIKSMQGVAVRELALETSGAVGDRRYGVIDAESGKLMSAKRWSQLLMAATDDEGGRVRVSLPDGATVHADDPEASEVLSRWLGRPVRLDEVAPGTEIAYEMTLDPPNDEAELFDIPAPKGSFVDLAPVHLLTRATLDHARSRHPDLQWDVRRFRPNVVIGGELEPFADDGWPGRQLRIGGAVVQVRQPTVRCAMPLRAQPGLDRQRDLYDAMQSLHANHLGVYADVVTPGTVRVGDSVELL